MGRSISASLKASVLERDGWQCRLCGKPISDGQRIHIDHIIPHANGGRSEFWNLRTTHSICNMRRTSNPFTNAQFVFDLDLPIEERRRVEAKHRPLTHKQAERHADEKILQLRAEWAARGIADVDCSVFREQVISVLMKGYTWDKPRKPTQ